MDDHKLGSTSRAGPGEVSLTGKLTCPGGGRAVYSRKPKCRRGQVQRLVRAGLSRLRPFFAPLLTRAATREGTVQRRAVYSRWTFPGSAALMSSDGCSLCHRSKESDGKAIGLRVGSGSTCSSRL